MRTLLITVSIIGIAVVVGTIIVGTSTFEGTVVPDPYEAGLRWDEQHRAREASGWTLALMGRTFRRGTNELSVALTDRQGAPVDDAVIIIQLSYPSSDRHDREVRLHHERSGRYRGMFELPLVGQWNVQFVIAQGDRQARFLESIYAAENTSSGHQ